MFLSPGVRGQTQLDDLITVLSTITAGGTAQLALPQQIRRAYLSITNNSAGGLTVGIGPAIAHATISGGALTAITVDNGGVGYVVAPKVRIFGGLTQGNYGESPPHVATAYATISAGVVTTVAVDDPGAGYAVAPLIYLENALPQLGGGAWTPGASSGVQIAPGETWILSGPLMVPASAVAIFGATTAQAFTLQVGGLV